MGANDATGAGGGRDHPAAVGPAVGESVVPPRSRATPGEAERGKSVASRRVFHRLHPERDNRGKSAGAGWIFRTTSPLAPS